MALTIFVDHLDGALPGIELGGGEFAEVQHLTLHDAVRADANTLANGVIDVRFVIFAAEATFQEHDGGSVKKSGSDWQGGRSAHG
jgi:hypothetical protein